MATPSAEDKTLKTAEQAQQELLERFPDAIVPDTRKGYTGFIVKPENLLEVAGAIKEMGFDYLSNAAAVDYIDDGKLEMVYHAYSVRHEVGPLVFKAQVPRDGEPTLPSLVSVWPGVDFQEREAWDLMGIRFEGHPNLKRILLWEGFHGHPLRKDWHEPYYEADTKPFKSRHPNGKRYRAEEGNPFGRNVQYPPGFSPDDWTPEADAALYAGIGISHLPADSDEDIRTERIVVNMGPQHPSTHGVFRMIVTLNGETVEDLEPVMGYLHRNHEKIGERNTYLQNMPYTDRLDYITSMSNNLAYAIAVEKLIGAEVPERAEWLRVLMVELTRIVNHIWAIGFLLNDLGAFFTPALYAMNERELVLDVFEATAGSRMMCNYMRFGGVVRDLPARLRTVKTVADEMSEKIRDYDMMEFLEKLIRERLPRAVDELDRYLTGSEIVIERLRGVGILPPDMAIAYSASGPVLRASGVPYDVRRADGYSIYDDLDWDVAVRYNGDAYDRYLIRLDECRQSLRILDQVLDGLRATEGQPIFKGKPSDKIKPSPGEVYGRAENPKGELGFYIVSNGTPNPWRYHIRAPSFINLTALSEMCKGHKVADIVAILGSIDIVLGEVDR